MDKWDEILSDLKSDPLFAGIKPVQKRETSSDRLVRSFEEINNFIERTGHKPTDVTFDEKLLAQRLEGIKSDKQKYDRCLPYDRFHILGTYKETNVEDELRKLAEDPVFTLTPEAASLFDIPDYMRQAEKAKADYIGQKKQCEDFSQYEQMFKQVTEDLRSGKRRAVKFREAHLKEGNFFVINGVMVYLDKILDTRRVSSKIDGRTRCIYENGIESDILLQSIARAVYEDGYTVVDASLDDNELLKRNFTVTDEDNITGYVYVLRSKSKDPELAAIKDLYKIGFCTTSVEERISNAKNEATYLYAPVEIVTTWTVYNIKAVKLETAIHRLFAAAKLKVAAGRVIPKEWYVVPLEVIIEAVPKLIEGQLLSYDPINQRIVDEK